SARVCAPSVFPLIPCCGSVDLKHQVTVGCLATGFMPSPVEIEWNRQSKGSSVRTTGPVLSVKDGLYIQSSQLTILASEWKTATYQCNVAHTFSGTKQKKTLQVLPCTQPTVQLLLQPPCANADPYGGVTEPKNSNTTLDLFCRISDFYPEKIQVKWLVNGKADAKDPILHDNGTYSAISTLKICSEDWERGEKFTCSIRNQDLPSPLRKTIYKYNGTTSTVPSVYVLPPPLDELHLKEISSVTCYVKNFHPNDVLIKWLENGNEVNADKYENITPVKNNDGTFFTYSRLSVDESKWSSGNVYTCVVGHEALPYYITQQSIDKSSGKPNNVSVSLVMSESLSSCH
uniref:Ig-like domain-containing protein n=1 Tax=Leptobrachium leishanense TaxID=445787 RepID=A0A8C5ME79_9ANUR